MISELSAEISGQILSRNFQIIKMREFHELIMSIYYIYDSMNEAGDAILSSFFL